MPTFMYFEPRTAQFLFQFLNFNFDKIEILAKTGLIFENAQSNLVCIYSSLT